MCVCAGMVIWAAYMFHANIIVVDATCYEALVSSSPVFQGNSNNIATVDISAGFVGLDTYVEIPAVLLTAFGTYAGPVLWASHLVHFLNSETRR